MQTLEGKKHSTVPTKTAPEIRGGLFFLLSEDHSKLFLFHKTFILYCRDWSPAVGDLPREELF